MVRTKPLRPLEIPVIVWVLAPVSRTSDALASEASLTTPVVAKSAPFKKATLPLTLILPPKPTVPLPTVMLLLLTVPISMVPELAAWIDTAPAMAPPCNVVAPVWEVLPKFTALAFAAPTFTVGVPAVVVPVSIVMSPAVPDVALPDLRDTAPVLPEVLELPDTTLTAPELEVAPETAPLEKVAAAELVEPADWVAEPAVKLLVPPEATVSAPLAVKTVLVPKLTVPLAACNVKPPELEDTVPLAPPKVKAVEVNVLVL
jgi:hypothetical protein